MGREALGNRNRGLHFPSGPHNLKINVKNSGCPGVSPVIPRRRAFRVDLSSIVAAKETIQIFISSPGDVGQERVIAERVIERLQGEFAGRADLDPIRWEWEPLRATEHFQEQITPPAETDIALFILWSRLGTPLPEDKFQKESGEPYRSGTEWEFENAVESYQERGTPDLLTYRKTKDPEATLTDKETVQQRFEQKSALDAFIDRWFKGEEGESFRAAFHTFETPGAFERQLEEHLRALIEEHLPQRYTEAGQIGPVAEAQWHRGSPFRGLRAFEAEHAPIFFGRTEETSQIIEALEEKARAGAPFVLVTGPSGSGKSSGVRAGVVPTLTRPGVAEGVGLWRRSFFRPSDAAEDLLEGLARALLAEGGLPQVEELGFGAGELGELLREAPERTVPLVEKALEAAAEAFAEEKGLPKPPEARLLLTIDQLEEIFTLGEAAEEERQALMEAVRALVESGHVWAVATLRSDFFGRCAELPALMELKEGAGHYDLEPPSFAALGYMIRGPVRAAGLEFERDPEREIGLDEVLHEAAAEAPEALPLLEFTLEELYRRRTEQGVLTFEAYEKLGGLTGAIAERAEATYESLEAGLQEALPEVLRSLVTIEPEGEGGATGQRVPLAEAAKTPEQEALVDEFVEARLLVTGRNDAGKPVVSLAHEALLREWPRLEEWIDRNRTFLQSRARIRERATHWEEEGRPDDLLLPRGRPLAEAKELISERKEALGETLETYIERSVERAERKRRRRRQIVGGVVAAFFFVVAGFGLFSYQQWTEVAEQRDLVMVSQSRTLTDEVYQQVEENDAVTGMLLALEALPEDMSGPSRPYVPEAQSALYHALMQNREEAFFDAHSAPITDAALGPEGRYLATASEDSTIRLYDLDQRTVTAVLRGHDGSVTSVSFDSSASRVATAGGLEARVWTVPSGEPMRTLSHEDTVRTAYLSPDGGTVLLGIGERPESEPPRLNLFLHSVQEEKSQSVQIRGAAPWSIGFSPEGRYIYAGVTVSPQGTSDPTGAETFSYRLHLWERGFVDASTISIGRTPDPNEANVGPEFLKDGRQLAIKGRATDGGYNFFLRRVQIPDLSTITSSQLERYRPIGVGEDGSLAVAQSPGLRGDSLFFFGSNTGQPSKSTELPSSVSTSSFGPQKHYFTTGHRGGAVRVWALPEGRRLHAYASQVGEVQLAEVRPNQGRVVAVGRKGVQAWSAAERPGVFQLGGSEYQEEGGQAVAVGPDGRHVARIDSQGRAHLVSLTNDTTDRLLAGHEGAVLDLAFDPEGRRLATAGREGTARLWNTQTGEPQGTLPHDDPISLIGFAESGRRVITITSEGRGAPEGREIPREIALWNTQAEERLATIDSVNAGIFGGTPVVVTSDRSKFLVARDPFLSKIEKSQRVTPDDSVLIEVRSAESGDLQARFGDQNRINRLPPSTSRDPNHRHAVALGDSLTYVLDLQRDTIAGSISFPTTGPLQLLGSMAFSPNGRKIALSGAFSGDEIRLYELSTQKRLHSFGYPSDLTNARLERVSAEDFGPEGTHLATVGGARNEKSFPAVWRVVPEDSGAAAVAQAYFPSFSDFAAVRFDPEGRYLLAAGDEEVRIYGAEGGPRKHMKKIEGEVAEVHVEELDGKPRARSYIRKVFHLQHPSVVGWARFTPNGERVVTRTEDGRLRAWPVFDSPQALIDSARSAVTRHLTAVQREQFNLTP